MTPRTANCDGAVDPPRPVTSNVAGACRRHATAASLDTDSAEQLVDALRLLSRALDAWRCAALDAARCQHPAAALVPIGLGELARRFAAWLDSHPERANEPVDWLLRAALPDITQTPRSPR